MQRRWQDGCRNLALVGSRLGVRYILYPRGFLTQPVGCVKRLSTFALNSLPRRAGNGEEEQATPAKETAERRAPPRSYPSCRAANGICGRSRCRSNASACRTSLSRAAPGSTSRQVAHIPGRAAVPGRFDPAGARPLLSLRPAADRDHGRPHVRPADRRIDRASQPAAGLIQSRALPGFADTLSFVTVRGIS